MWIFKNHILILVLKLWKFSRVTLANSQTQTLPSFSKTLKIREWEWEFSRFEGFVDRPNLSHHSRQLESDLIPSHSSQPCVSQPPNLNCSTMHRQSLTPPHPTLNFPPHHLVNNQKHYPPVAFWQTPACAWCWLINVTWRGWRCRWSNNIRGTLSVARRCNVLKCYVCKDIHIWTET